MDYRFQVNLGGIIDLLSQHIYSSPQVFIRELLQNAVDAITARLHIEPAHRGEVFIELPEGGSDARPVLIFRDNGVGLPEEGILFFLPPFARPPKRGDW